jgi:hypothetical protein
MDALAVENLRVCGVNVGDGGIALPEMILAQVML